MFHHHTQSHQLCHVQVLVNKEIFKLSEPLTSKVRSEGRKKELGSSLPSYISLFVAQNNALTISTEVK